MISRQLVWRGLISIGGMTLAASAYFVDMLRKASRIVRHYGRTPRRFRKPSGLKSFIDERPLAQPCAFLLAIYGAGF